ncbi:hypothetical protein GCM10010371_13000 [Streptomyces subrutilus]|uniref:Uncharacterized protein n=1 Tax=Streptomyces subrutilus TaxID=36818 RepID=A0A918QLP7_9ACTN|nr:hypothetical protein GCM10010371_13000 [Streptomyces subrutilus]
MAVRGEQMRQPVPGPAPAVPVLVYWAVAAAVAPCAAVSVAVPVPVAVRVVSSVVVVPVTRHAAQCGTPIRLRLQRSYTL